MTALNCDHGMSTDRCGGSAGFTPDFPFNLLVIYTVYWEMADSTMTVVKITAGTLNSAWTLNS